MFPRLGSTHESTDMPAARSKHSGSRTQIGNVLKNSGVKTRISMRPAQDESSFVQLVEIEVAREEQDE